MKATYIDHMGTDLSVVNAARVSFGKRSDWVETCIRGCEGPNVPCTPDCAQRELSEADQRLIQFLARGCTSGDWDELLGEVAQVVDYEIGYGDHTDYDELGDILNHVRKMPSHWSPFAHTAITLHVKAPIFVARQLAKHQVGMAWNEVSRRYVDDEPEFYVPEVWRKRADNVKQGSSDEPALTFVQDYDLTEPARRNYIELLNDGVCPEQARMVLPQSTYTEWYWTGSLYAFANVYNQRSDSHTQRETQEVAKQIGEIVKPLFPVSWKELTK